ncbi:MAG: HAD-IA family hydrolase [Acetobacteraceae bacterium]|nr:HAD-IA family hydrolase [Acetobacteraceae bacterium]
MKGLGEGAARGERAEPAKGAALRRVRVMLFDLDGTLLDTRRLHLQTLRHVLRRHGRRPATPREVARLYGLPLEEILAHFLPPEPGAEMRAAVAEFVEFYLAHRRGRVRPYPGTAGALRALVGAGVRPGVVTSKRRGPALGDLEESGPAEWVRVVVAREDSARHKPDPLPLLLAMEQLSGLPGETLMVGDSWADLQAGRAAGVATALALWGAQDRRRVLALGPDFTLRFPRNLLRFLPSPLSSGA